MMKILIWGLRRIFVVLLGLDFLFWVMAQASGHRIPYQTNLSIGVTAAILILLILALSFYLRKTNLHSMNN